MSPENSGDVRRSGDAVQIERAQLARDLAELIVRQLRRQAAGVVDEKARSLKPERPQAGERLPCS